MRKHTISKAVSGTLLIGLILTVSNVAAQQYTLTDEDVVVENGIITSCSYDFTLKDIIIPEILDEQTVIGTGGTSFSGVFGLKGITSVELPATLEFIGDRTFYENDLTSLDLSSCIKLDSISNKAFNFNSISSLDLSNCTLLTFIGDEAFSYNSIASLDLSNLSNLIAIGNRAFRENQIPNLDLSDCTSLTSIGSYAFSGNRLTSIDLTSCASLLSIETHAFSINYSLAGFHLPEVTYGGATYSTWIDGNNNLYIAGTDMATDLSTLYVPYIPYTLTDEDVVVENGGITSCSYDFALKNIIIPQILDGQTVTGIGSQRSASVFRDKGITSVELPASLEFVGISSFEDNDLVSLDLSGCTRLDTIERSAFESNSIPSLNLSNCSQLIYIGNEAFNDNSIASLDLSNLSNLIAIGYRAFRENKITNLDLSDCTSLTSIGSYAFSGNRLTSVDLTSCASLLSIETHAFSINYSLAGFHLPEVTYNGTVYNTWTDENDNRYIAGTDLATDLWTFYVPLIPYTLTDEDVVVENGRITSCSYDFALKNIIIPQILDGQTVTGIGSERSASVFRNKGITSVELPASLEFIGISSFENNDLVSLDLSGCTRLDTIERSAFESNSIPSLNLSNCSQLIYIGNEAFSYNSIASLDLSNLSNLIAIGYRAFRENKITNLDLSDCTSLTSIGSYAFSGNRLTSVDLTSCASLLSIENYAFSNNYSLAGFHLPEVTYGGATYSTWIDGNNNLYIAGTDIATDLSTLYVPYIPYTLTDEDVVVKNGIITSCSYGFELKNIIIPQTLDGQTVIGIDGPWNAGVFSSKGITTVGLPTTLEILGENTFKYNELVSLDLSGCTKLDSIGNEAFYSNSIPSLDLSNCTLLTFIGESAFKYNSIASLNLSNLSTLIAISGSAFSDNRITNLDLSDCKELTKIEAYAFNKNKLTNVNLTNCTKLLWIGDAAFYNNYPFAGFALPEVIYDGTVYNTWIDGKDNRYTAGTDMATDMATLYVPFIPYTLTDEDVVVENGVITSCSYDFELKNIIIPETLDGETVTGIIGTWNSNVFSNKGITTVELPQSLEIIGNNTFTYNNLASLDLSGCMGLVTIGSDAFQSNNLLALDLSNCTALETIGASAFSYNKISDVDLTSCANLLSVGTHAFYSNSVGDFALPDPIIPGYFYSIWIDGSGGQHDATERVNNLRTSYTRIMPEIDDIIDVFAPTSGNKEITLVGKDFEDQRNGKQVLFRGIESLNYISWSDTSITLVCPPNPAGPAELEIPLDNNITYRSPKQFYYSDENINSVCGDVSGTWETGKTYLLTCSVTVREDDTLIIEEGVRILAMSGDNIRFLVNGTVVANGTRDNPITFTSATENPGDWEGISISGTYNWCKFNHCIFEYARTAISLSGYAYGCDDYDNASEFNNCIVRNNAVNGFYCSGAGSSSTGCSFAKTGSSSPLIQNCWIYGNSVNGIEMVAYDGYHANGYVGAKLYNNIIFENGIGIYCHGDDWVEPKIINNVITKNQDAGIRSIHSYFDPDDYQIANNIISDNGKGIINEDTSTVLSHNNGFWANDVDLQGEITDVFSVYQDPIFTDPENDDFILQPGSPCIDAGSGEFVIAERDLSGKIRIFDGTGNDTAIVDMGAYEFGAPCSKSKIERIICEGSSIQIGDSVFTDPGSYTIRFSDMNGCDSIVILDLIVNPVYETHMTETICEGASIQIGDSIFTQTGNYAVPLFTVHGCDSIVNLDLTVNPVHQTDLTETICQGESVWIGDSEFTETGNYSVTLTSIQGCDSIVNLDLLVNPVYETNLAETICPGESIQIGDSIFMQTGNYSVMLSSMTGCDSVVNLDLNVSQVYQIDLTETICWVKASRLVNLIYRNRQLLCHPVQYAWL